MKTIKYLSDGVSGCHWYRSEPLELIGAKALQPGEQFNYENTKTIQLARGYGFDIKNGLVYCKNEGIKIIYDTDDALHLVPKINVNHADVNDAINNYHLCLNEADLITTTTETLKKELSTLTSKPIQVIPNCFREEQWKVRPGSDRIRIGFVGSITHIEDLLLVLPDILELQQHYDFDFIIAGMANTYQDFYEIFINKQETKELVTDIFKYLAQINFIWYPPVAYYHYPKMLRNLNLTIGLCPLTDSVFNRNKSCCKFYEYALVNTLTLASNVLPYKEEPAYLVTNWLTDIKYFLDNPEQIREELEKQRKWVLQNRNINKYLLTLKEIYN